MIFPLFSWGRESVHILIKTYNKIILYRRKSWFWEGRRSIPLLIKPILTQKSQKKPTVVQFRRDWSFWGIYEIQKHNSSYMFLSKYIKSEVFCDIGSHFVFMGFNQWIVPRRQAFVTTWEFLRIASSLNMRMSIEARNQNVWYLVYIGRYVWWKYHLVHTWSNIFQYSIL